MRPLSPRASKLAVGTSSGRDKEWWEDRAFLVGRNKELDGTSAGAVKN